MSIPYKFTVYPNSIHSGSSEGGSLGQMTCFMARDETSGERVLGVRLQGARLAGPHPPTICSEAPFSGLIHTSGDDCFFSLNHENAAALRKLFAWLIPVPLEADPPDTQQTSFGFGDRLGLATSGHIQALRETATRAPIAPIFAQQSVRENARTGRTPQQVMDDATWGVFQEGWRQAWGADADHLKQVGDLAPFVEAGYTFFTIDPGEYVDPAADSDSVEVLEAKIAAQPWGEIEGASLDQSGLVNGFLSFCAEHDLECDRVELEPAVLRAQAKYGMAVIHIVQMYRALVSLKPGGFDFEPSVDETESPTSVLEHYYIASQLKGFGVRFTSLALRLPGRFEKGVDYIGDLEALEAELARHVAVMRQVGGYKFSLHSGSDKFSLYAMLARHAGTAVHVKTAGTSYLEALRVAALLEPALFRHVLELACQRYSHDRQSYHVSAEQERLPKPDSLEDTALPSLLDDFHVREALHVTFGSALAEYESDIKGMLRSHPEAYNQVLVSHFRRHLEPLIPLEPATAE
jgi:tagaturonate epimerase